MQAVVLQVGERPFHAIAAIGMVGDGGHGRHIRPDRGHGHVASDGQLVVGLQNIAVCILPADELLPGHSKAILPQIGLCADSVLGAVLGSAGGIVCTGQVGNRIDRLAAVDGVNRHVIGDGVGSPEGTIDGIPAHEFCALGGIGFSTCSQFSQLLGGYALPNGNRDHLTVANTIHAIHSQVEGGIVGRCLPTGIEHQIVGGHFLTVRIIGGTLAILVVEPADELIAFLTCRGLGRIRKERRNRSLVINCFTGGLLISIKECNGVLVPSVIEFGTIIACAIVGTVIIGKAGQFIFVFLGNTPTSTVNHIPMVFDIFLSFNILHHVVGSAGAIFI